jgi:hypothetical protein
MKGVIKVLNAKGHSEVKFDTDTGVVKEAEEILAKAREARSAIFDGKSKERISTPGKGQEGEVLKTREEVVVVPMMAGGS